jgi:hypothetical protein
MTAKVVNITIPNDKELPDIINTFSPEENYVMLKIGIDALGEGRKIITHLTNEEVYKNIESEFKKEIENLDNEIELEKQTSLKMQEKITKIYESQIEQLNKKLENAILQIKNYEQGSKSSLYEEINKVKEKYDLMYREKEKQVERMTDVYEKMLLQQSSKSTSYKGSEGEKQFQDYANTFIDFKGFKLIDKHTQGGEGDFHLHFEEFDVLADAKNYKKKVPVDQREKIKKDLLKNQHIHFGWLVSLNTSIDKFDRAPIMYEWINTTQCLVYINNLCSFDDPSKILRIVWFTCKELKKLTQDVNLDEEELVKLKEQKFTFMDKIKGLRKNIREINTSINATKNLIQLMDDQLKEMLDSETSELIESNFSLFDEWWKTNVEVTNDDSIVISTDIWFKFKQENKDIIKEFEITPEKFKQFIKSKVSLSSITIKSKNANSAFDIKGVKLIVPTEQNHEQENKVMEVQTEKLELELNEEVLKKKKVIRKNKSTSIN